MTCTATASAANTITEATSTSGHSLDQLASSGGLVDERAIGRRRGRTRWGPPAGGRERPEGDQAAEGGDDRTHPQPGDQRRDDDQEGRLPGMGDETRSATSR